MSRIAKGNEITKKGSGATDSAKIEQGNLEAVYVKWYDNRMVNTISAFARAHDHNTAL